MILVYFNLITIYESMGTAKSPLGIESWTGNDVYVSMDTCFTEKRRYISKIHWYKEI